MNHNTSRDRDPRTRRSAIELPYPANSPSDYPSPPQSNISARQSQEPGLHRADSIASYHSHHSGHGQNRYDQRPKSPPTDPPTPPKSRRGSVDHNDQLHSPHVPQEYPEYNPQDYPDHEDSSVNFTPPSSTDTVFNDQRPLFDDARPTRGGTDPHTERIPNQHTGYLNKVTCASSDGAYERVEYYDPQGRLIDAKGIVIINEPEHVLDESQDRDYEHNMKDQRHHRQDRPIDVPSNQQSEDYNIEERYPATQDGGDQTPRQRSPAPRRTAHREERDPRQSRVDSLRQSHGLLPRPGHHVQESRDTRYDPPISRATEKYPEKSRGHISKSLTQRARGSTQSYNRDPSPAQSVSSVSSFDSRYSAYSHHAKDSHRSPRMHRQESSESSRRSLSPGKHDRRQKYQSARTRDRPLNPLTRYQSQNASEKSRDRSVSPPRNDHNRRGTQVRSADLSSLGSDTDDSAPRRSKSGESLAITMIFTSKSKGHRSRDSKDSWDKRTYSGPSPVRQTLAPAELARRKRVESTADMASIFRELAEKIERGESDNRTEMRVISLSD
jgi:hypothetical protein